MKDKLVSREDIRAWHPIFRSKYGDKLIDWGVKISGLNIANDIYDRSKHLTGPAFCKDLLDKLSLKRTLVNVEILEEYKNKPFITVSNHAYGHVDGIAAIETVASRVDDYKIMVNFVLGMIDTMAENFITVNPYKAGNPDSATLNGIKQCIEHIRNGHAMGFFPSGAVSNIYFKHGRFVLEDREWQASIIKLIKKAEVPVIPMHFSGRNSIPFYLSRLFGWQVRTLLMCHELYNKKDKEMVITFGNPIMPEEMASYKDDKELGEFLKLSTYRLGKK
ncbi:MAG TPA: hypothetical protein DDZ96_15165 [Porphyromonadaceae bacterium]|jgi:putative hemolysin|uniref:1-acyl-sn-glycerol-3-phosphate acyltransferase n=1 Tax=Limibacterium fermenti TaxID=3229863 RepID=UPI000E9759CD|nr:hypothetical protein [Porphyromonadaceae bacterium]HBK31909.1 hypothetical protein [Porphyromonadaceae bacterium]HBL35131.1 hypothetical protein [Porphyromonadaceae bacterium]HBX19319.1 hypothetical protein [Porphyromonadaceae bacterium]HBX45296.1 hypothetical protein [Porphyromonadaceae bacterium]